MNIPSGVTKAVLTTSVAGLLGIAGFEGYSYLAYQPLPGDKWTVGFGHTEGVRRGDKVTLEQALGLLKKDVAVAEKAVNTSVKIELSQHQYDALVSLTYNIGGTAFKNSTLLKCLNEQDLVCVNKQWMRWVYFKGEKVKGLENRRARELAVFNGEQAFLDSDGRVCFGSAGCLSASEFEQHQGEKPDGADGSPDGSGAGPC
jgi:lysozyme